MLEFFIGLVLGFLLGVVNCERFCKFCNKYLGNFCPVCKMCKMPKKKK